MVWYVPNLCCLDVRDAWAQEPPKTPAQAPAAAKKQRRQRRKNLPAPPPPADRALPLGPGDEAPQEDWILRGSTVVRPLRLPPSPAGGGWAATPSSLLLYSPSAKTLQELGIGYAEEEDPDRSLLTRRILRGGVSKDGRFAWHWEKTMTLKRAQTDTVVSSTRAFAFLGTNGVRLWSDDEADAPARESPARMSESGETMLVRELRGKDWSVAAVDFTGNRLMEAAAGSRIQSWSLTPTGRFAHFCWSGIETALVCSFLSLEARTRKDVPASELPPGELRVLDDGSVLAGGRLAFRLR